MVPVRSVRVVRHDGVVPDVDGDPLRERSGHDAAMAVRGVGLEAEQARALSALHELDDASALEIDGWNEHLRFYKRMGRPWLARYVLSSGTACSEKWNTEAARAASAQPVEPASPMHYH